ncbi:MAG: type II secretion system F family protein [Candidatus Omnitrophica bacterium]|nr:type II secretion system F family protein [Candidatus Omnitrophota bacterium]
MPQYTYLAKNGPSKIVSGVIHAEDEHVAVTKILQLGYTPLEVKLQEGGSSVQEKGPRPSQDNGLKVPLATVAIFIRQIYDMIDAGIPLLRCFEILMRQKQHPALLTIIEAMHEHIKEGGSLSGALALYPKVFPLLYINMVKSGELAGQLPHVMSRLADFIEKDLQIRSQVKSSLLYPAIILVVGLLTMFVLMSFVLPKLTVMFDDFDAVLPLPTQMIIAVSSFFSRFWWLMIIVAAAGGYYLKQFLGTARGRLLIDHCVLKIPILRQFIQEVQMALFARTLGTLLESGVTISAALESVTETIDNSLFKNEMQDITLKVKAGDSLTTAIKGSSYFSEIALNLIIVGQESGKLEKGLYKLAVMCERSIKETSQNFMTILGPLVLIVVVALVGFVIVSILLPMFRMNMIIN